MNNERLTLEFVGYYWPWWGDLWYLTHPDGRRATISVSSVGDTWVAIRRVPEGGYFHTEPVDSYQAWSGALAARAELVEQGFSKVEKAYGNASERLS